MGLGESAGPKSPRRIRMFRSLVRWSFSEATEGCTFEASEEVFDLPLETKLSTKSDKLYKGYAGQVLLNGGVFPPLHRVVITGKKDRHAAGLFLLPEEGLIINAPEEVVDDEHR
ncbi:hypothetical protein ISN44_As08g017010 [Arabidopsis suecica]|uniref:Uncharacterized protein n=1 Tax=Arabidopsis suecica TaxID=45249 RepID=A0A8T2B6D7_ARASU|nr:hypothetical protein ISN44_As08g017010 [Arabidopsis suecica]